MWLAVAGPDAKGATAILEAEYLSELDEVGRRAATVVIDVTAPTRQCPACLAEYAAGPIKCPECGLFIGA
ncbi:MAG: hypothetical protein JNL28_11760 [Planctomycetes bacterium]|nr:hypothetical protein [Planctomycetota bacterium]